MPQIRDVAVRHPDKIACLIAGTDQKRTYRELDALSNRAAQLIASLVPPGGTMAILLPNCLEYAEIVLGARRAGVYFVPISTYATNSELEYFVENSNAGVLFAHTRFAPQVDHLRERLSGIQVVMLGDAGDYTALRDAYSPDAPLRDVPPGREMCYSSGTTGLPKGIRQPLKMKPEQVKAIAAWVAPYNYDETMVSICLGPMYHAAPLRFLLRTLLSGGTAVIMPKFDAEEALRHIERYRITHGQWVPTMFYRLLQLPEETRNRYDLSSQRAVIHAAAPCPPDVKWQMLGWWGDIIWEFYAGTEYNGATLISSREWREHPGSVGRAALGNLHIVGENGAVLSPGEIGDVYFDGFEFEYWQDPVKTAQSRNAQGWTTLGDVGYLDAEGYLFLTDRRAHMIISGGVNIYPSEVEAVLVRHPAVRDAAVFGVPNAEFGEEIIAVVEVAPEQDRADLAEQLTDFCRADLSRTKCPRHFAFVELMPRLESGKLQKHVLRDRYLAGSLQ